MTGEEILETLRQFHVRERYSPATYTSKTDRVPGKFIGFYRLDAGDHGGDEVELTPEMLRSAAKAFLAAADALEDKG